MDMNTIVAELLLRVQTEGGAKIAAMGAQLAALDGQIKTLTLRETEAGTVITANAKSIDSSSVSVAKLATSFSNLGIVVGGAALAFDGFAVKAASQWQASLEQLHTQAGVTQDSIQGIGQSLLSLSGEVATGPEQLAQAMYHVSSAGFQGAKALDMVKAAAEGAKVGQADLETTTQAMIAIMAANISGINTATDAIAAMNAVIGSGDLRMNDLAQAMSTGILPAAVNAGLGFRDVGAALAVLGDNSLSAEEGATRLRMTFALMEAPSKAAADALKKIGLSSTELASDMRQPKGLLVALEDLKTHLHESGLSAVEQAAVITKAFGGGRSSGTLETLLEQLDRLKSKYGEQAKAAGDFGDAWAQTQKTVKNQTDQLIADFDRVKIEIGSALLPQVDALAKALIPVVNNTAQLTQEHKTATGVSFDVAAGIVAVSLAIRAGIFVLKPFQDAWKALKLSQLDYLGILGSAPAIIGGATAAEVVGLKVAHDKVLSLEEQIAYLKKHEEALTSDQRALVNNYGAVIDSRGEIRGLTHEMSDMLTEVEKHRAAMRADTQANQEYAAQRAANTASEREATGATDADTAAHIRHKKSLDDEVTSYAKLQAVLKKYQDEANSGLEAIAAKLVRHQQITQADLDAVRNAEAGQSRWNDALAKAQGLVDGDTEALSRFTSAMKTLENQGLVSHAASMAAFADVGISQAQRMHSGVVSEVTAMMKEVATAEAFNPIAAPQILGGPAPIVTTATEHGHSVSGNEPTAAMLTPEAQQALSDLNKTIAGLPPELQGTLGPITQKFNSDLQASFQGYLQKVDTENTRDAQVRQQIVDREKQSISDAYASAEEKDKQAYDTYLQKLKSLEDTHNQRLAAILADFNQKFQTALADFQAKLVGQQTKADELTQTHNDRLRELYDSFTTKLQGIHGKNADERKRQLEEQYARSVQLEDAHYRNGIKLNEQGTTSMAAGFDRGIKGLDDWATKQVKNANSQETSGAKGAADTYHNAVKAGGTAVANEIKKAGEQAAASAANERTKHETLITGLNQSWDNGAAKLSSALEKGLAPDKLLATMKSGADDAYNKALANATLDELNTSGVSGPDRAALALATGNLNELSGAEAKAKATVDSVNESLRNFGQYLSDLQTTLKTDEETVAGLLLHPKQGSQPLPPTPSEPQSIYAQEPKESKLTGSIDTMVEDAKKLHDAQDKETQAELILAQRTGDTATAFQLITQQFDLGKATLAQYTSAEVANAQHQKSIDEQKQSADLAAAQATGDTAKALQILTQRYEAGSASLADVTAAYSANQQAVEQQTRREIELDNATGQFGASLSKISGQITSDFNNAQAKLTEDFLSLGNASQADIDSAIQAKQTRDRLSQAEWDASFSVASLADQSRMLSQRFSALVSHESTISGAQSSVDSASIQVIAAQSTLAVDELQAVATNTADVASIVSKMDAVSAAGFKGQLDGINDATRLIADSTAVLKATSPEALRVAQQQLLIDQVTAQEHRAEAAWQVRLASDALRTEQDKARGDQAAAAAQIRVAGDALQVATDQRQLAVDQQQLTLDQLDVLADIDSAIGGVNDYGDQIKSDLAALSADKQSISSDQASLGNDTASANAIAAYNAQQAAMDSLLTAYDQSGSSSTSQDYQLQLAYLEQQKALYQVAVDQLSTQQQMASNLGAYSGQLQQMLFDFMGLLNLPAVRKNVVGMGTAQQMNGGGYAVQTLTTVTPS